MKKTVLLIAFIFSIIAAKAQIDEGSLIQVHSATTAQMNALNPDEGALIYNTTDNSLYVYNGSAWEKHKNSEITTTTTSETINIGTGNQTLNVRDASKIIGFSLLSNFNSLSNASGKMIETWIINDDRDKIRCLMQAMEHPNINYLTLTVQVKNASNTIKISKYTSRYWNITNVTPQASLSNNGTNFQLDKIIILRKE